MTDVSIERVAKITPEVIEAAYRLTPQLRSPDQVTISPDYLQLIVESRDNFWLMARRTADARLIGMASLLISRVPTNVRGSLESVVVDAAARSHGVGTSLCLEAKDIAAEQDVNILRAAALKTNDGSRRMLEKAGFVIVTEHNYFELSVHEGARF